MAPENCKPWILMDEAAINESRAFDRKLEPRGEARAC